MVRRRCGGSACAWRTRRLQSASARLIASCSTIAFVSRWRGGERRWSRPRSRMRFGRPDDAAREPKPAAESRRRFGEGGCVASSNAFSWRGRTLTVRTSPTVYNNLQWLWKVSKESRYCPFPDQELIAACARTNEVSFVLLSPMIECCLIVADRERI